MGRGWFKESRRHALASRGIITVRPRVEGVSDHVHVEYIPRDMIYREFGWHDSYRDLYPGYSDPEDVNTFAISYLFPFPNGFELNFHFST